MLIGLSGYAGAGKDEVANALADVYGFERRAFADKVRAVAYRIGWDGDKDDAGRRLLQQLGHAVRVELGEDAWVRPILDDLPPLAVVTDVRYPNEAEAIIAAGGTVWRVTRPGVGPVNDHVSEHGLDGWDFDLELVNDGSLADLRRAVREAMGGG